MSGGPAGIFDHAVGLLLDLRDLLAHPIHLHLQLPILLLESEDPAHTFQVQALSGQVLDELEALDVVL